jgi:uncharacterized protein YkwD
MTILMAFLLLFQNARPEIHVPDLEQRVHELINVQRKANDRPEFLWNDELSRLARAHSEDMAKRRYFKHVDPEGLTPMKRAAAAGYTSCQLLSENIYQNNLYSRVIEEKRRKTVDKTYIWNSPDRIASTTVKGWLDSPDHRQNILDKNYSSEGIGVAIAEDDEGKVYVTQMVCGAMPETENQER